MQLLVGKSFLPAAVAVLATLVLLLTGCGGNSSGKTTVTVFAAASLTDAFRAIADAFESENAGTQVKLNFAGSQRLRSQLELGATADVFASADERQMKLANDAGLLADEVQYFASTTLSIIVWDQSGITDLGELGESGVRVVLAHGNVPAGVYSRRLLDLFSSDGTRFGEDFAERVMGNVVSEETSVKVVEQKVVLGEADAGIVYRPGMLSALPSGAVRELPLPPVADVVRARYPIAALKDSESREPATDFIRFVLSRQGQEILAGYGFDAP